MQQKKRKAKVEQDFCVACGCCERVCPVSAINIKKGMYAEVNSEKCVGCGKCVKTCPASVIHLEV